MELLITILLAVVIGASLGLLGGGGSILTVPALVYVIGLDTKVAIASSLLIVGVSSLVGAIPHWIQGNIRWRVAAEFGVFALTGSFIFARFSAYLSGELQLLIFAGVMLLAAVFMFRNASRPEETSVTTKGPLWLVAIQGFAVGSLTGLVGVGGGFLIVPALVLIGGSSMRHAIGTSVVVIALNSFAAFLGYIGQVQIPWGHVGLFITFSTIGTFIGAKFVGVLSPRLLKTIFAVFLVLMGIFLLAKNWSFVRGGSLATSQKIGGFR